MPALLTRIETRPTSASTFCGDRRAVLALGDVEGVARRLAAGGLDLGGGLGRRFAVDVEHDHLRALARIAQRDGAADAGPGAGDGGDV